MAYTQVYAMLVGFEILDLAKPEIYLDTMDDGSNQPHMPRFFIFSGAAPLPLAENQCCEQQEEGGDRKQEYDAPVICKRSKKNTPTTEKKRGRSQAHEQS
jgi:hypothetical protein